MSLKKDKFKLSDKKIMNFAIRMAENNKYFTRTNPSVGCVIVKKKTIPISSNMQIVGPFSLLATGTGKDLL